MKEFRQKKCLAIGIFICMFALIALIIMLLWNALLPAIFTGVGIINYWQSAGLIILCRLLFGGFPFGHGHKFSHADRMKKRKIFHEMHEKTKGMTQQERMEFIRCRWIEKENEGK